MLSKGGKIKYTCPYCDSEEIKHRRDIGDVFGAILDPYIIKFNSGWCYDCRQVFCWSARNKVSLKKKGK